MDVTFAVMESAPATRGDEPFFGLRIVRLFQVARAALVVWVVSFGSLRVTASDAMCSTDRG